MLCEAFGDFNPEIMVTYDDNKVAELLQNDGVIKNKKSLALLTTIFGPLWTKSQLLIHGQVKIEFQQVQNYLTK